MFPDTTKPRNNDLTLLDALTAFEPTSQERMTGTCGNIQSLINPEYLPGKGYVGGLFEGKYFHECVSAPYLLAKLCAGYEGLQISTKGQEGYKTTWTVVLKHKASGAIVTFYDWKGTASVGSNLLPNQVESPFEEDLIGLMKALAAPRFPHPYDGCVIGEIA